MTEDKADDPLRHALPEAEHERIFRQRIVPSLFDRTRPVDTPTAIILGGQPGAGKTAIQMRARKDLEQLGSTVVISGDDLRSFHPAYARLQRSAPATAAFHTDRDSGRWVEMAITEAIDHKVNIVIESTMRDPLVLESTAAKLRANGYQIEARALAVNERLSWQGVHQRYEAMMAAGRAARFTVRASHDAGAAGMLEKSTRRPQRREQYC